MAQHNLTITNCLTGRAATSRELQHLCGLSQSAVSKQIRQLGDRIVRIPNGRMPLYGLTRNAFGSGDRLPLYYVDAYGNNTRVADIRPLASGGFFVECEAGAPAMLLGEAGNGYFDDLPYYLQDLKPQGFIGRQIARDMARVSSDFPPDPRYWSTGHVGRYLLAKGEDLPGNFIVGEAGLYRRRLKPEVHARDEYPVLARSAMEGSNAGSSAGGEQPKFTAFCQERNAHVIVKFSPSGDGPNARRWRDILITEHHATEALHRVNFPAAETKLIERGDRLFLESLRFDRQGEYGRSSMISMQAIDSEYVGNGADWPISLNALFENNLVSDRHLFDARVLWEFGYLINNTDMHLGNISLAMEGNIFRVLPAYDMCSMGFRPLGDEVPPYQFRPEALHSRLNTLSDNPEAMARVVEMALDFWHCVAADTRISNEFREFLAKGSPVEIR